MEPILNPGVYVVCCLPAAPPGLQPLATFQEKEGLTVILAEAEAQQANLPVLFRAAWITLTVHSDLQAVGLTGAFAGALAEAGISCNVLAGAYHDHIFVPIEDSQRAMTVLFDLQKRAQK